MPPREPESVAVELMARLLADREAGGLRPLREYLDRYPGHETVVAREYMKLSAAAAAPDEELAPAPDEEQLGPYRLLRELGRGGQGTVWLAEDPRLARQVAVKVVPRSPLLGDVARRFEREARAASRLDHPGICAVHDVGVDDTVAWMAMRYVPGESLAEILDRGERPDVAELIPFFERAARALHAAHEAGVVHRDVKPGNLMRTPDGEPVLLDFGVAHEQEEGPPLTLTGDALGTPAYMSPEQLDGARADPRTDVWSLGATLYEALTGRRPFDAPTREGLVQAILGSEPDSPRITRPGISRDLDVVLRTALTKEVDGRYQTALDLAEDLRRVREGEPIRARPAKAWTRVARWSRRNPGLAASLAATFLILVGALAVTTRLLNRTQTALESNAALLDEVTQLADAKVARDMVAEERELWPALPAREDDMQHWLNRARDLEQRLARHKRALEEVGGRMTSQAARQLASKAAIETDAWMHEQLAEIVATIEVLVAAIPSVERRLEFATTLERRSLIDHAEAWAAARERVRKGGSYRRLDLAPQLGLVPLGPDPVTGLEELAHLATGEPPARGPGGALTLGEETGIVLVLVPGATTRVGSVAPGDEHPLGDPHVDPYMGRWDGPVQTVRLDPFLISKYEMTIAQWRRQTGEVPAAYQRGSGLSHPVRPDLQPIEQVSWDDCARVLGQLDLTFPTEAQWEYAARAGTTTPWYTGEERESLDGHVNLPDRYAKGNRGHHLWEYEMWLDDGALTTAPVGSYLPNPFGLHDVHGNVAEWCADGWEDWALYHPRDGDGLTVGVVEAKVFRGGTFGRPATEARASTRNGIPPFQYEGDIGIRPARRIDP